MLVCQSAAPRSMQEAAALLRSNRGLLELRTDAIRGLDLERLLRIRTRGLIITNRTAGEGGSFRGEEAEQFELLSTAVRMGAEYVDVEWRWGASFFRRLGAITSPSRRILSHHDTRRTPPLTSLYERMRAVRPEVIKIAVMARDITDT